MGLEEERKVFLVSGWDGGPVEIPSAYKSRLYITSLYSVIYMLIMPRSETLSLKKAATRVNSSPASVVC